MEKQNKKVTILVCAHKKDPYTRNEGVYKAIQVGKALHPELDLGYINDNEGENVSDKNPKWCELSALYWGWKNLKNVEYAGLCHYRRYFDIEITEENIDKLLKNKDILVLERWLEHCNLATRFMELVSMEDFYLYLNALLRLHPEYKDAVLDYCYNSNMFYRCTMFVAKKEIYDDFCETFFPVFFELDKTLLAHGYNRLNRAIAYLGELSLGIYITHKKLKPRFVPMKFYPDNTIKLTPWRKLRNCIHIVKCKVGFRLLNGRHKDLYLYEAVTLALKGQGIVIENA